VTVYTLVGRDELADLLRHYDAGELLDHEGIVDGIENTSYFVTGNRRRMVLTPFETHRFDETRFLLDLMAHLPEHDIPAARPLVDRWLSRLHRWRIQRPAEATHRRDPGVFRRILSRRQLDKRPLALPG